MQLTHFAPKRHQESQGKVARMPLCDEVAFIDSGSELKQRITENSYGMTALEHMDLEISSLVKELEAIMGLV
jgi:hypothetical protein